MSLINRVLQDLEARRASPPADVPLPGQVRAVTAAQARSYRGPAVLILGLVIVIGAIVFALTGNPSLIAKLKSSPPDISPLQPAGTLAQASLETPDLSESVQAQVEAALMMPVFQLSEELSIVPQARRATAGTAAVANGGATAPAAAGANSRVPASGQQPERQPEVIVAAASERSERGDTQSKAAAGATPVRQETPVSKAGAVEGTVAVDGPADDDLEQVVIPADVPGGPIEKQARQLTSFERAENLFRLGVASLRRGRMADAETQFRAAISEDRSHDAAQQALVGILIDAGRMEDAEAVLAESLSANPRQPKQAMILARLQVARGDLEMAMRTLEDTRTYAGTDAVYLSFLAAVLQRAGQHEEAAVQYRNALAFMPRNAIWLMGLGISLRALGNEGEALQAFDEATAIGTLEPGLQAFVDQQRAQLGRAVN
jgi:MSHA biogenesis protein MshN